MTQLDWSDELNKRIRSGSWSDQAVPTTVAIQAALAQSDAEPALAARHLEQAAQLIDYFLEEAKVVYAVYKVWQRGFSEWLEQQGVTVDERDAELARLATLLAYPDGVAFDPRARWDVLGAQAGRLANRIRAAT